MPDPNWLAAQICAVTANSMGAPRRLEVEDFLPRVASAGPARQSTEGMKAAILAAVGG